MIYLNYIYVNENGVGTPWHASVLEAFNTRILSSYGIEYTVMLDI